MPPTSGFYAWLSGWLDWLRSLFFKREMELSLIGLNKGGKSTLVHVLTTGQFQEDSIPTVSTRADPALSLWALHPQHFQSSHTAYMQSLRSKGRHCAAFRSVHPSLTLPDAFSSPPTYPAWKGWVQHAEDDERRRHHQDVGPGGAGGWYEYQ